MPVEFGNLLYWYLAPYIFGALLGAVLEVQDKPLGRLGFLAAMLLLRIASVVVFVVAYFAIGLFVFVLAGVEFTDPNAAVIAIWSAFGVGFLFGLANAHYAGRRAFDAGCRRGTAAFWIALPVLGWPILFLLSPAPRTVFARDLERRVDNIPEDFRPRRRSF